MRYFALAFFVLLLLLIYSAAENRMLIVRRYRISAELPEQMKLLKAVQISDLHKRTYSGNWKRLIFRVKSLEPDVILITGDLVSRDSEDFGYTEILVRGLCTVCPVYCCLGNHELDLPDSLMKRYREMMIRCGAVLLENQTAVFEKNGAKINIAGASLKRSCYKNEQGGYSGLSRCTAEELENSLGKKNGFTVLLAHNPFFAEEYAHWGAELTFSGHVHGGVVRIPVLGGLLSPERRFLPDKTMGVYDTDGKKTLVSTGIGKYRFMNPPEILYAEIYPETQLPKRRI